MTTAIHPTNRENDTDVPIEMTTIATIGVRLIKGIVATLQIRITTIRKVDDAGESTPTEVPVVTTMQVIRHLAENLGAAAAIGEGLGLDRDLEIDTMTAGTGTGTTVDVDTVLDLIPAHVLVLPSTGETGIEVRTVRPVGRTKGITEDLLMDLMERI